MRRLGKIAGYLVLALLLVGVLVYYSIINPLFNTIRDPLVSKVMKIIAQSLNGTLEVGTLRGSLLSAPVLHNVVLRDDQGEVVGQIESIRLTYDLTTLITQRPHIHTVEIVRPQLTLTQKPDGSLNISNLLAPGPPPTSGGAGAFILDRLDIRDGQLTLRLPALPGVQQVEGLNARLSVRMDQDGLRVQIKQLTAHTIPADVDIRAMQGVFQTRGGVAQVEDLRLQTGETLVTANGVLPGGKQPADFAFQSQPLALAEIGRLLQKEALQEQVDLTVKAVGPPEALQVRGQLSTRAGNVDLQAQINSAAIPLRYSGKLDITHLNLAPLVGRTDLQSDVNLQLGIQGEGVAAQELRGEVHLEIEPSHLGPVALYPSAIHLEATPQHLQVQRFDLHTSVGRMTASGALDLSGTSDIQYALTADVTSLQRLVGTEKLAGAVHLEGQASGTWPALSVRGTLQVDNLLYEDNRLHTLHLTYEGSQLGSQPQVTAHLLARQVHAGTVPVERVELEATYQGSARQVHFSTKVVQAVDTGGKARGTLILGETEQQLVLEELVVQLPNRPWHAVAPLRVTFGPQRLQFDQIHLAHADESLTLSGAVVGERLQDVQLHVAQLDLSYLQRLFNLPHAVAGRATLQVQLMGTLADPHIQSDLTLRSASPQQLPFEQLRTTLAYEQHRLQGTVQLQQANRDVLALDVRLPIDLALTGLPLGQRLLDAPVAVRLHLRQPNLAALQRWQAALPKLTGTLQGTLAMQGTYAALHLDADVQLQQLGVEGVAEQVQGPVRLTGSLVTATSVAALAHAIQQGQVTPHLQHLELRVPTLRGKLPAHGTPGEPFQVHDLLLQAAAQWTPKGPQVTLQHAHLQTSGFGLPRTDVLLEARWTPQRLDLTRLQVRLPQSEVRAQGSLTFPEQHLQLRSDILRLRLDELPLSLPPTLPPVIQGVLTAHGSLQAPQVEADLRYAGGKIRAELAAQLQQPLPRYNATLRLEGLEMAQMLPGTQGRLQAGVRLQGVGFTGDKRRATLEMSIDTDGLTLAPGLTVRLQANLAGDTLQVARFDIRSTPATFAASGTLSATAQTAMDYRLTLGDLKPLSQYLGVELQAKGGLTGKVQGTRGVWQTQLTLQLSPWHIAQLRGQRLHVDFAATQLPAAPRATLKAQFIDMQGPSLPATSLSLEVARTPQQGTFTATVTKGPYEKTMATGTLMWGQDQRLTLHMPTVRLRYHDLAWENTGPVALVRSQQGQIQVQHLAMHSGSQQLTVGGMLMPNGPVQVDVQVQQLQIRPMVQAFAPKAATPDGSLTLNLTVRGTVQQPQIQGELQLTALQWQKQKLGDMRATLGLSGTTARLDLLWQEQGRQLLQVRGTMGLGAPGPLDVQIQASEVDLRTFALWRPAVTQSAGMLGLDLRVAGTLQQPQVRGSLTLRDGILQLAATGERYKDIQARLLFAADRLDIEQFHIGSRSGPLQLTGHIAYTGQTLRQIELALQAQNFTVMRTPDIEAVVSAQVQARGSLQALTVNGSVSVPRARVALEKLPGGGPKVVEPWELTVQGVYGRGPQAAATTNGVATARLDAGALQSALRADLQIDIPRNVWVQGSGTSVEMSGNVRVTKERNAPFIVSGTVETVRGFATFYSKKFDLRQGRVTFTGSPELNPLLDIMVARKVSDYLLAIQVGGTAQKPELTLSSTPALEQMDILSLLVIGKTTDRLSSAEQGDLSKQAQQVVGNVIGKRLEDSVGKTLGLDTVEITTDSAKIGRYVTQDLFLSYERNLGGQEGNYTVGAEYNINRRLKLKGSSNDVGGTALDLIWRLDY